VAVPCLKIKENPDLSFEYTSRGNLIAVISNGTAVLGLGNIGPLAGKPVMEGKGVLFKRFANIDVFDIELDAADPDDFIRIVKAMEPTFGGINLEDIKAPECFYIEEQLAAAMAIPVFHDDQHGTAIISGAGLLNAAAIADKTMGDLRIVINGAGAAGIACSEYYISAGARRANFTLCDSKGAIYKGRKEGMNPEKARFAQETSARTLEDAMRGADIFVGLSIAKCVTQSMVKSMAEDPIIFAMANPTPEILPDEALEAGAAVVGTGRSDFPNQINNVLGFPGIFRGALDVQATDINEAMKLAASKALAEIVSEKIPEALMKQLAKAYPEDAKKGIFDGKCPLKPFDPRVVPRVARYVADAAIKSGVAQKHIRDLAKYEHQVAQRIAEAGKKA
jgi:malate dehydrogenase (oxaloacetate-decarboxylating)(NADP+)